MTKSTGPTPTTSPIWPDVYAELRNKIRWAIGSTVAESGVINLSYRDQLAMAGPLAQQALEHIQAVYEKPNLRIVGGDQVLT